MNEYERQGKANLFLSVEPLAGKRRVRIAERHTGHDFAEELKCLVDDDYRNAEKIVLVTENLNTHGIAFVRPIRTAGSAAHRGKDRMAMSRQVVTDYTPEHGSWLNMSEVELSCLHRQYLDRRIAPEEIAPEVLAWEEERNEANPKILWQFTTADARIKLRRLYPVTKIEEA